MECWRDKERDEEERLLIEELANDGSVELDSERVSSSVMVAIMMRCRMPPFWSLPVLALALRRLNMVVNI